MKGAADASDSDPTATVTGFPKAKQGQTMSTGNRDVVEMGAQTDLTGVGVYVGRKTNFLKIK